MDRLRQIVRENSILCLAVNDAGWDNARGYSFDPATDTLYFPVSPKQLEGHDLNRYEVLIWSQPRVVVVGRLTQASTNADAAVVSALLVEKGWEPAKIDYMLYDQRNHQPRKNQFKLTIDSIRDLAD